MSNQLCRYALFAAVAILLAPEATSAQERSLCDAILQSGIFDQYRVLDQETNYRLTKEALCNSEERSKSGSGSLNFKLFKIGGSGQSTKATTFCNSTFDDVRGSRSYWNTVSRASEEIVSAWSHCIEKNISGVSHYIQPLSNPQQFYYKIVYTSNGPPYTVLIDNLIMKGHKKCDGEITRGTEVGSGGIQILCERDPTTSVAVLVNTIGGTGMRNVRPVDLPKYKEDQAPPPLWTGSITTRDCRVELLSDDERQGFQIALEGSENITARTQRPAVGTAYVACRLQLPKSVEQVRLSLSEGRAFFRSAAGSTTGVRITVMPDDETFSPSELKRRLESSSDTLASKVEGQSEVPIRRWSAVHSAPESRSLIVGFAFRSAWGVPNGEGIRYQLGQLQASEADEQ